MAILTIAGIKGAVGVVGDIKGALKDPIGTIGAVTGIGDIKGTVTGALNTLDSVLGGIGLDGAVSSTVGAVLANGMDVSCWGSAYNPERANADIQNYWAPIAQGLLDTISRTANDAVAHKNAINNACKVLTIFAEINRNISNDGSYASCSRKGWAKLFEFANKIVTGTLEPLVQNYQKLGAKTEIVNMTGGIEVEEPNKGKKLIYTDNRLVRGVFQVIDISKLYEVPSTKPATGSGTPRDPKLPTLIAGGKPVFLADTKAVAFDVVNSETVNGGVLDTVEVRNNTKPKDSGGFNWWYLLPLVGFI